MIEGISLIIEAAGRPGRYRVRLGEAGDVLLGSARCPLFEGCRELIRLGADPDLPVTMREAGSAMIRMTSTVGRAARSTVEENDRLGPVVRRFRPFPSNGIEGEHHA